MESLKEKVVIVTGAGSGIGRATALMFAQYGAQVVIADMNVKGAEQVAVECRSKGLTENQILVVEANVTRNEDRRKLIEETISKFGRLDVLVNNAGIGFFDMISDCTEEQFDQLVDVNMKSVVFLTQLAIPHLKTTKGKIVNLASIVSSEACPRAGIYAMTKAAIDMFSRTLALEMAQYGVRVNSVRPGIIQTQFYEKSYASTPGYFENSASRHPLGRLGTPDEVATAIAYLASDMARYTTGSHISVDGGRNCVGAGYNAGLHKMAANK